MRSAVIVDAVRTPIGRRNGFLKDWHPVDLSGRVIEALLERTGVDPAQIDDVIWGCVSQTGEQTGNIGRFAALAAGLPEEIPGVADRSAVRVQPAGGPLLRPRPSWPACRTSSWQAASSR